MAGNPRDVWELTEQDIIDFIGDDADSELACLYAALGSKALLDLMTTYGGCSVYIPNLGALQREKRNRIITKEFQEGVSITKLARSYGVSTRQIYTIVYGK